MKTDVKNNGSALTIKDFKSDQDVRWCPGCGDHIILATMQKVFAQLDVPKENIVAVSGIGCSSRLPYYLDTYGIHSIHGRAAAVATGLKLANPELSTWIVSGDGDSMAIGGNHFIHACRRNVDMNMIIFNNKIYGMTKGQSSPTTPLGVKTKTAPEGTYEPSFTVGELAISAGATFFARVPDNDLKLMEKVMLAADAHEGMAVIEVLQNCVIFTDGIHEQITGKDTKDDNQLVLEHGKPMVFGKDQKYGLRINGMKLEKVPLEGDDPDQWDTLIHDASEDQPQLQIALAKLQLPNNPVAMGILRDVESTSFSDLLHDVIDQAKQDSPYKNLSDLFHHGNTWQID
jgi:2-oxoglutarate ferredoxin oxidoreductase subunit beta